MDYFNKSSWSKGWGLRFNLGLVISLSLTLVAFEWKSYGEEKLAFIGTLAKEEDDILDIPNTIQQPPPPPRLIQPEIVEIPDDEETENLEVDLSIETTPETAVTAPVVVLKKPVKAEEEVIDDVFTVVEENAMPEGGMPAFYKYLSKTLKYPSQARRMNVEGTVYVQFVIEKDGSLTDIKIIKSVGAGCDEEAGRVFREAKKWKAGKQRGLPVRQRMVMPIIFNLG